MQSLSKILNDLHNLSSTNLKKELLNQNKENENLKIFFRLAYDPYIKFNIARVVLSDHNRHRARDYDFSEFLQDLDKLVRKEITGNQALEYVEYIYWNLPEDFRPFLEKMLKKDLKIGVSIGLINDTWPNWIPEFKLGLCERFKKIKQLKFPYIVEPKIDGTRALCFVYPDGTTEIKSRAGLVFNNYPHIEEQCKTAVLNHHISLNSFGFESGYVFDGELKSLTFNSTMSQARRIYNVDTSNFIYRIWDVISVDEFLSGASSNDLFTRKFILRKLFENPYQNYDSIRILPDTEISSKEQIIQFFEYWHKDQGEEGIILKNPHSFYPYCTSSKRSKDWIKYKIQDYQNDTGGATLSSIYSVKITEVYPGERGTKYEFILGGFEFSGIGLYKEQKVEIIGKCGGGYKDEQRKDFWERRHELIGKIIDIEAQEVSVNKDGYYSLRFPVFKSLREDLIFPDQEL